MGIEADYRDYNHTLRLKHAGVFDYGGLLRHLREWIINQDYEFHERTVKHKVPSPSGYEEEILWTAQKEVNAYVRFHFDIYMHIYNIKDIEVIKEGKKHKLTQASLLMEVWGRCEFDWSNRFGGNRFLQLLNNFFLQYIVGKNMDVKWTDELYYRLYKFQKVVKEYLDFESKSNAYEGVW